MSEDRSTRRHPAVRVAVALAGFAVLVALHLTPSSRPSAASLTTEVPAARPAPVFGDVLMPRPRLAARGAGRRYVQPAFEIKSLSLEVGPAVPAFELRPAGGEAVPTVASRAVTVASWYGPGFNGRLTANGETYDQEALTAAHPTLPFGSLVRVTNLTNGRQVIVRINDRGPFVAGRGIDLSHGAARVLDMEGQGITQVALEVLSG